MGNEPTSQGDEQLVRALEQDVEKMEEIRDPLGLGHDPEERRTIEEIADKRSRS